MRLNALRSWRLAILLSGILTAPATAQSSFILVPNRAGPLFGALVGQTTKQAVGGLVVMGRAKSAFQAAIQTARDKYWAAQARGTASRALALRYDSLLTEKDKYFIITQLYSDNMSALSSMDLMPIMESLTGGLVDGGIHWFAKTEFDIMIREFGALNLPALFAALKLESPVYQRYRARRDLAEHLFWNPSSPLRSANDTLFMAAYAVLYGRATTPDSSLVHVRRVARDVGQPALHAIAERMRATFTFSDVQRESPRVGTFGNYIDFEVEASTATPAGFARIALAKRNGISVELAERLRRARRERYTPATIDSLERLMLEAWNAGSKCASTRRISEYWPVSDECITAGLNDNLVWVHDAWVGAEFEYTDAAARHALRTLLAADSSTSALNADSLATMMLSGPGGSVLGRAALFAARYVKQYNKSDTALWEFNTWLYPVDNAMRQLVGGFAVARADSVALGVAAFAEADPGKGLAVFLAAQDRLTALQRTHGVAKVAQVLGEVRATTRSWGQDLWGRGLRSDSGPPAGQIEERLARK